MLIKTPTGGGLNQVSSQEPEERRRERKERERVERQNKNGTGQRHHHPTKHQTRNSNGH